MALYGCFLAILILSNVVTSTKVWDGWNDDLEWWQTGIIYQIYPRSFQDSNGDGVGDLKGIQSRLDHLSDIGVNTVWLSPIFKSPMADLGYDISNYTEVDPLFGTIDDFKDLLQAVKNRGMHLLMDFVPNHSSDQHEWFQKSIRREDPYTNYYVWRNGTVPNSNTSYPNNWSVREMKSLEYRDEGLLGIAMNVKGIPILVLHKQSVEKACSQVYKMVLNRGLNVKQRYLQNPNFSGE